MASQALYLKWRPQRFEDVVGQEHVTTTLKNALRSGRISHAYLFSGPRGTGKTTMARLLTKAVNCLDEDVGERPCNRCHICQSINEGRQLDLIEMDAASHTGVDNVREAIRDKVGFRPVEARYKVYVIDEVHMLSTSAFNALLKTLEEPPEHVIFCLATTEPHKILPTILSRCQHFEFHRIPLAALVSRLRHIADQEGLQVEDQAFQFIARMSTGCARDAIGLLDQLTAYGDEVVTVERVRSVLGLGDEQVVCELIGHLSGHDVGQGLSLIQEVVEHGADVRQFTQQVIESLRSTLLMRVGGDAALPDLDAQTRDSLAALVDRFSTPGLLRAIKLMNQAQLDLRGSDQSQLALEIAFVEAAMPEGVPVHEMVPVHDTGPVRETVPVHGTVPGGGAQPGVREDTQHLEAPPAVRQRTAAPASRRSTARPAAPRRAGSSVEPESGSSPVDSKGATPRDALPGGKVTLEEIQLHWAEVRRMIRQESRQVEALVNSSVLWGVEDGDRLVLGFPSELLSGKLEKEANKRIVEAALSAVLGRRCRVRGAVQGDLPAAEAETEQPSAPKVGRVTVTSDLDQLPPEPGERSAADPYQEAASDPVIQDLVSRGGQVTDVQVLPEE